MPGLSTQDCDEIRRRYNDGESVAGLVDRFDVSRSTVYRVLESVPKRPQSDGPNAEVGRLYEQGLTGIEIEKLTGVKRGSQWSHPLRLGIRPTGKSR